MAREQRKEDEDKDTFRDIPWLNSLLTYASFIETAALFGYFIWSQRFMNLALVLSACLGTGIFIWAVKGTTRAVFSRVSARFLNGDPLRKPITMHKFVEQSWQLGIHVLMTLLSTYVLSFKNYLVEWDAAWIPSCEEFEPPMVMRVFYCTQLGIWIFTAFAHRFFDERHKDYFVMFVHHVTTIALVGTSFVSGYARVGVLTMFLHDVSDIPIDLLKMLNWMKLEGPRYFFATETMFVLNLVSWMYFRLYGLPRFLFGISFHGHGLYAKVHPGNVFLNMFPPELPGFGFCFICAMILYVLHVYWFALLVWLAAGLSDCRQIRMAYKLLTKPPEEVCKEEYDYDSGSETELRLKEE